MENLTDTLIEQLKDLYSAEIQLVEALPKMVEAASDAELKKAFQNHLKETKNQVSRLEKIATAIGEELGGHTCKAMKGLVKEGEEAIEGNYSCDALKDVQLVAAAQRIEHYEIAGYGNAIALAEYLELSDIVKLLEDTIVEEGNADKGLTKICETKLFPACEEVGDDEDWDDEDEDLEEEGRSGNSR